MNNTFLILDKIIPLRLMIALDEVEKNGHYKNRQKRIKSLRMRNVIVIA